MNCLAKKKYEQLQNQILQKKVDALIDSAQHDLNVNSNTIVLAVLHDQFGWGHDRLMRFVDLTNEYQKAMSDRYGNGYDITAMKKRLREECFIDVEQLVTKMEEDKTRGTTEIDIGA